MPRRASSLTNISNLAVSREIDSKYDAVKAVSEKLPEIDLFLATDTDALIASLNEAIDFTGIIVESGALANWDSVGKVLTVPTVKGDKGDTGLQGETGATGATGATGPRGAEGPKGDKGDMGAPGEVGPKGLQGDQGPKGDTGADLTIEQIGYDGNGTFTWQFSDGTAFTTPDLRGDKGETGSKGDKGDTGISVHHTKGTQTTDPEGDFSTSGERDTYTMYGDADETLVLGWFTVQNGWDPYDYAVNGGYTGTREEFNVTMSSITNIETESQLAQWRAEANEMTADSFANEAEDVEVKIYTSNGDGTFTGVDQTGEYSALHYKIKTEADYQSTLALGNGYVVADNTEKDALTELTTADTVFVTDDGDGKWARYQVTSVTDGLGSTSTFQVIMDEDTYLHANTASDIKSAYESNLDTNAYTDAEKTKLDLIEYEATADQTGAEIKALYEAEADTNAYTDAEKIKVGYIAVTQAVDLDTIESDTNSNNAHKISDGSDHTFINQDVTDTADVLFNSIAVTTTVDGRNVSVDGAKLDTIEENAKDDQTSAEIKALYESEADTNAFTDAEKTKLADTEITSQLNARDTANRNTDNHTDGTTNGVYTLAERSKLLGIETGATADQTDAEIKTAYENNANTNAYTDAEQTLVDVGTALNTTATTLPQAVNEVDSTVNTHIASTGEDHSYIDQNVTTTGTPTFASVRLSGGTVDQGVLSWNVEEETIDLVQNGTTLQLGQEIQINGKNTSGAIIPNGTVCMATGTDGASGNIHIAPYTSVTHPKFIVGVATEDIAIDDFGKVCKFGKVRGINTSVYAEGEVLYVGDNGAMTNVEPTSGLKIPIAFVLNSKSNGTILVREGSLDENAYQESLAEGNFVDGDKTKLDGIEVGATADQTKVDIDGLGIDAATVNGKTVETSVPAGAVYTDTTYTSADFNLNDLGEKSYNSLTDKPDLAALDANALAYSIALG